VVEPDNDRAEIDTESTEVSPDRGNREMPTSASIGAAETASSRGVGAAASLNRRSRVPALEASAEKVRFTLELTPEMNRTVEALARQVGATKSDVLRRAISLVEVALEAKRRHQKLGVIDEDDHVVSRIVGL
jgi:hypothetical protein